MGMKSKRSGDSTNELLVSCSSQCQDSFSTLHPTRCICEFPSMTQPLESRVATRKIVAAWISPRQNELSIFQKSTQNPFCDWLVGVDERWSSWYNTKLGTCKQGGPTPLIIKRQECTQHNRLFILPLRQRHVPTGVGAKGANETCSSACWHCAPQSPPQGLFWGWKLSIATITIFNL